MKSYYLEADIPTLGVALSECVTVDDLKKLAALLSKEKLPTRKAELAAVVMRQLEGERLQAAWHRLDALQRAAVAEVVHSGSTRFAADRFRAKYGQEPNWGTGDEYSYRFSPSALCLFFYGKGVMPRDLKERLKAFVPPPVPANLKTVAQLPAACAVPFSRWNPGNRTVEKGTKQIPLEVHETERPAREELLAVLRLVDAGKVSVSEKTRRPSAATVAAVTRILVGVDYYTHLPVVKKRRDENAGPIRAFAWPLLLQAGRLAQLSGSKLRLTKGGRRALAEPAAETIRTLWSQWLGTSIIDELSRIECVKGQTGKGKRGLTAVSPRRDAVAGALAECPVGAWISATELFRFLRASGNDFSVTRNSWNLYVGDPHYGSLGYEGGERILEKRYLLCLLLEYAATLGLIDVALIPPAGARQDYGRLWGTDDLEYFSRYDGLMYFRLNHLGAYCLGVESTYRPPPLEVKPVLRILPNLEVAATGAELQQGDRLALDAYATRISDLVWRLDVGTLLAAVEAGRPVEEIREFLSARSGGAISGTVSRLLQDVADRSTQVHDRGLVRLVECADAALAALIANDSRTRKHCMRAGERHLVVPAASEAAFKRGLREVGYMLAAGDARPRRKQRVSSPAPASSERSEA